jgi:hypothetical protein
MLPTLPPEARVWIFTADQTLDASGEARVLDAIGKFLPDWTSHGRPVPAEAALLHGRFLIVGAHLGEEDLNAGLSGCGIDAMTHAVERVAIDFEWLDGLHLAYRDADDAIQTASRAEFRALNEHGIERPLGETWAARAFGLTEAP